MERHLEVPYRAAREGRWGEKEGNVRVGGCATTCVDLLWGSGHSVAAVRRSSVSGSLARDQVVCPILYVLLPLALENSSNEDQRGKEEWERKFSQYIRLHPHLECGSF